MATAVDGHATSLQGAEDMLAEGIYRSLVGGVNDIMKSTTGLVETQDVLLETSRALLEDLNAHDTKHQAGVLDEGAEKVRATCLTLTRVGNRLAALRKRAEILEAELEADGCVAGDNLGELRL